MAGRTSAARFFDHKSQAWFSPGDEVPAEVAERLSDNPLLFEERAEQSDAKAEVPRRGPAKAAEK